MRDPNARTVQVRLIICTKPYSNIFTAGQVEYFCPARSRIFRGHIVPYAYLSYLIVFFFCCSLSDAWKVYHGLALYRKATTLSSL
jgi:hypothetical protein